MSDARPLVLFGAPMLPDPARLAALTAEALAVGWLSNGGALHARLERALSAQQAARDLASLTSSGTMALTLALMLGGLPAGAEVITTPLTFAATAQAIAGLGLVPVFADVEPETLTLCPRAVERAITPRTAAILPVHFLGVPSDVAALAAIAARHGLWLVHDAAHAFGVTLDGLPIGHFGDASGFSLHATKLLNTAEGGFVVTRSARTRDLRRMRNFGIEQGRAVGPGLNGKMSELHAAMGLALLPEWRPKSRPGRPCGTPTTPRWTACRACACTAPARGPARRSASMRCGWNLPCGRGCIWRWPRPASLPATISRCCAGRARPGPTAAS